MMAVTCHRQLRWPASRLLILRVLVSFAKLLEPPLHCMFVSSSWAKCIVDIVSCLCCFKAHWLYIVTLKSHGQRSLVCCSPWGREESDTTEWLHFHFSLSCTGEGNGNPLQFSCLENPRDSGAWWAAVYGVTQSRTRLKRLSSSSSHSDYMKINIGVMLWAECVQSQNLYAEALTPNMMVLGGGAFGRQLDLHEIVKVLPLWR